MTSSGVRRRKRTHSAGFQHLPGRLCLFLCAVAFALRVYDLGELSLWYDEGWSVHLARLTPWQALPEIMSAGHTHPPLYYLLLGMWQTLAGPSEFSMRFPSLASGVLMVATGYRLGGEVFRRFVSGGEGLQPAPSNWWTGLATALFLAFAPSQIAYSQEARSYTLLALEYALLILLTSRFLRRQWRLDSGDCVALILLESMALYTHYFAVMLLACLGLAMVGVCLADTGLARSQRRGLRIGPVRLQRWLAAQFVVGLTYLPWIWTAVRQLGEHAPPDMQALSLRPFLGLIWRFHFSGLAWAATRYPRFMLAILALAILGAVSLLANTALRRMDRWDWFLFACFLLPLGAVFAVERIRPGVHPRYTLMLSTPLFLLLARQVVLWAREPGAQKLTGAVLGTAVLLSFASGLQAMAREHDKDDVRGLATHLNAEVGAQDLILFDYEDFAFQYYYRGQAPVLYLDGNGPPDPLVQHVLEKAHGRGRAFLVTWYTGHTDRRGLYPFLLEFNGRLVDERPFRGLSLRRYALEPQMQAPTLIPRSANYGLLHTVSAAWERSVTADGAVAVALRWRLAEVVGERYKASVILKDSLGRPVASVDSPLVNDQGRPTEEWLPHTATENYYVIPLPLGTPPLTHTLHVALYAEDALGIGGAPLDLMSDTGAPAGKHFTVGEVILTPPSIPQHDPYRTRAQMELEPVGKQAAQGLVLEAARVDHSVVQPGTPLEVVLLWRATEDALPNYLPTLLLTGTGQLADGQTLARQQGAPADGFYPTLLWRSGELLLDRRELLIGPQVLPGEGALEVQVGGSQPLLLTHVSIEETHRLFQMPSFQHPAYARFGEVAELLGYDLPITRTNAHQEVPLTLYWRAINSEPLSETYLVFTHLLAEGKDRLVAQHDGPPAEGRRPTTGWVQGEIIVDSHLLRWREEYTGTCPVEIGLYDSATGNRLAAYDGEGKHLSHDRLLLDQRVHSVPDGEYR
jgi:4-amino-4-deoxy-L-arabinose transferase-like glycosyltransferase